ERKPLSALQAEGNDCAVRDQLGTKGKNVDQPTDRLRGLSRGGSHLRHLSHYRLAFTFIVLPTISFQICDFGY
ncbi:MAG: hypothetical protein QF569_27790, partial [Candidatus Poribacteria bacterium]|nr:hypothetical protein [Candidatus Poribacteria bacterium]